MNKIYVGISILLGIIFLILAYIYFTTPANHLAQFLPGFDKTMTKVHTKHAIGASLLAIAAFVLAWFQSGKKKQ